jgi:hypothetical protein
MKSSRCIRTRSTGRTMDVKMKLGLLVCAARFRFDLSIHSGLARRAFASAVVSNELTWTAYSTS